MLTKINDLLTKAGTRLVKKVAKLLITSERYDQFFFEELRSQAKPEDITLGGNCVSLGEHYAVVRKNKVETAPVISIVEVRR